MAPPSKKKRRGAVELAAAGEPHETRHISATTQALLWGRAAGRCEFDGCNQPLWRSTVTMEAVNIAQKAHIYAFSVRGTRGEEGGRPDELNGIDNLLLVCPVCHLTIDRAPAGGRYTVAAVQAMKARHERRVEIVTGIDPKLRSHVLLYGANIGDHNSPQLMNEAASAMFPGHYPAEATAISLGKVDSSMKDSCDEFWGNEACHLESRFVQRVRERLAGGEVDHLSVFALAPQPLLILLGTLLGDITPVSVYQRHREPASWRWPDAAVTPDFTVTEPQAFDGPPALVLALSATVTRDRVEAVLGGAACLWQITVPVPHNELTKSREQVSRFRAILRTQLDRIKAAHGQATPLHVFPAASAAMSVELGRVRMPKADTPWEIYDQVNSRGGFVHALSIPTGGRS